MITGQKHYTTNGTGWDRKGCELYTVVCRTDPAAGADDALAVIAVPGSAPGITVVDVYDKIGHRGVVTPRVHFDQVRVPAANLIGQPGRPGQRIVSGAFSWTAALIGAACIGTMRAAFEYALEFARTETRLGTVPVIEHQNVGFMLADINMRIEACRYLTWKACHDFEHTGGRAEELPIMTKVCCSEAAVDTIYDCMRVVGIASYTKDLAPLERIMRDAMVFPSTTGATRVCDAGSCTTSSASRDTTQCSPLGGSAARGSVSACCAARRYRVDRHDLDGDAGAHQQRGAQ